MTAANATATLKLWDLGSPSRSARISDPAAPASRSARVSDPAENADRRSRSARVSDPAENADRRSPENQIPVAQLAASVERSATAPIVAPHWQIANQPCDRLVFSPDSTRVAVVSYDRDEVAICTAATGQIQQQIPATQCRSVAFSPDGRWLAFTVQDNVILWDWPRSRQVHVLSGHISTVTSVAFSRDCRTLATAGNDRRIKLWDTASGQLLHTMTGNTGYVRDIAFVDNGRLISAANLGDVHVWHTTLGQLLCTLRSAPHNSAHCLSVSPDGRHLALRLDNGQLELLDISREAQEGMIHNSPRPQTPR